VISYWPLLGVLTVIIGFAVRLNPVLVVVVAGLVSGITAGIAPGDLLALFGQAFINSRSLMLIVVIFPVIGVLERAGLRERATAWILGFARLTLARLLIAYLALRQVLSMFGLVQVAGHAQTVRPLVAPMSEATATRSYGTLDETSRDQVRALAAATDNVGVFFGEDAFVAFGAVLLIQQFYDAKGIHLAPNDIAWWALPTAGAAFVLHATRIAIFQLRLERRLARARRAPAAPR
jgi:uncharacterized membrane protein